MKEIVVFATEDQYNEKYEELEFDECYWTIPYFPKDKDKFIGRKIYFYIRNWNIVMMRATITGFEIKKNGKKAILFEFKEAGYKDADDEKFKPIYLSDLHYPKTKQSRGWCYKWWN
jgi:hypothetical protein